MLQHLGVGAPLHDLVGHTAHDITPFELNHPFVGKDGIEKRAMRLVDTGFGDGFF